MSDKRTAVVDRDGKVPIVDTEKGTWQEASRQEPGPVEALRDVGKELLDQLFG